MLSTATVSAATDIPSPAPTLTVLFAVSWPPPVKPLPATTDLVQLVAVVALVAVPANVPLNVPVAVISFAIMSPVTVMPL